MIGTFIHLTYEIETKFSNKQDRPGVTNSHSVGQINWKGKTTPQVLNLKYQI